MKVLGILAFAVALLLSVMVHEFGHYLTAKKFNMKVTEFFLGLVPSCGPLERARPSLV